MSSESEHDGGPPVLSSESVVRTGLPHNALGAAAPEAAVVSPPGPASQDVVDPDLLPFTMPLLDFGIAPISGELHLDLNEIESFAGAPTTSEPESSEPELSELELSTAPTAERSMLERFELKIAPLDMPDLTPSGRTPSIDPMPASATPSEASPLPPALALEPDLEPVIALSLSIPGLPTDPMSSESTPTTVVSGVFAPQIPTPTLPAHQPTLAKTPQVAARPTHVPEPAKSRKQKRQQKQQKKRQSGGGGIALFFTLLVLASIIAGAVVYGRPYLFPQDEDQLDGEAAQTERAEPLVMERQASAAYGVSMADHLLGDWAADLPMWRSLALAKGPIDTPVLHELVANWTPAYYSPETSSIIANNDLRPGAVESAVMEAMALATVDQETGWVARLDPAALDASALIEAVAVAESRRVSGTTSFGVAAHPDRRIDIAAFLPPVLEYRTNAPLAYAEFAESGDVDIAGTALLALSREPVLAAADTITTSQEQRDRTFWYMVFAAYNSPADAYAASNALVQTSLVTADRGGVLCTYATFSGISGADAAQLANVLLTWVSTAPAEMVATTSVLPDGAQQLSSCDPGAGFESGARFGVAREIARLRSVELAALENVDPQTGTAADRALVVEQVRATQAGLLMLEQPFDTPYVDSARVARSLVSAPDGLLGIPSAEPAGGATEG
ncbi:hypothetical protein [Ilumatobacter sp.]|uniref:hypothetical protein n=1 Tax=Ilumatobacter sp. TaxID=1967498 RepID=UPI0037523160